MSISASLITGLALGIEYVQASEEADIDYPCVIIDLLVVRIILELGGE